MKTPRPDHALHTWRQPGMHVSDHPLPGAEAALWIRWLSAGVLALALATGLASPANADSTAADGVRAGERSRALSLASAEAVEAQATRQYQALKREASEKRALASDQHPQLQRLRRIANDIIVFAPRVNERASGWHWEVNLIGSRQVNAFCMPGGKIAFFTGILDTLKLSDDEVAMVMGHEIAHALLEHGRERVGKQRAAQALTFGASIASQLLGFGDLGAHLASGAAQLTLLKYGREDETEADLVGMDIAARAGYDPRASVSLWQKMKGLGKDQPPQWLSTHPSHDRRIEEIKVHLKDVLPLYAQARGVRVEQLAPFTTNP